jgi:CBS domain-containing protein
MAATIGDLMTRDPITMEAEATAEDAARAMRDAGVGDVIVTDDGRLRGIVTDRDITVRAVAEGRNPSEVHLGEIASTDVATLSPNDPVDQAVRIMRERSVRRLPVVEGGKPVGVVSIGDLAIERDPDSALADISSDPPNN